MAQSLMLSSTYYDEEQDHRPSKQELGEASRTIKSGGEINWDEGTLAKLIAEQGLLEREGSPSWFRVILLILLALLVPFVALIVFMLRRCL